MAEVLHALKAIGPEGSPALLLLDDPPNHLWEGVILYREVRDHLLNHELEQKRKENQRHGRRR